MRELRLPAGYTTERRLLERGVALLVLRDPTGGVLAVYAADARAGSLRRRLVRPETIEVRAWLDRLRNR